MNRFICITLLAIAATGVKGGATSNQPIDTFLASGHELVHRLCQGGLGCGPFKTKWEPKLEEKVRPSSTDLAHFYGDDVTDIGEYKEERDSPGPAPSKAVTYRPESIPTDPPTTVFDSTIFSISTTSTTTLETLTETTESNHVSTVSTILFKTNTSLNGLERAVELMCKGQPNCSTTSNGKEHVERVELETHSIAIALSGGLLCSISLVIFACAGYLFYKKRSIVRAEEEIDEESVENGFECVDLGMSTTSSPLPSPPPTPKQELDENYVFDYGTGRYLQVTEL